MKEKNYLKILPRLHVTRWVTTAFLGLVVAGVAVAVGILMYTSQNIQSNKDKLTDNINNVSLAAWGYYLRAPILGGGGGSYKAFVPPRSLVSDDDGTITCTVALDGKKVTICAVSKFGYGTITASLNNNGKMSAFTFTGDFQEQ